ncbi:MAG: UvrD-helicase domain-containing protein, partial [Clostridia bacterium]|nr:UvrD-helicase domain-containing protein [Clostridia bacterium]
MRRLDEKWTTAQREAIRARGETLLVSAAAGSGKTAVLTERIIDRVLDEEHPLDLTQILVVTFTKAAAAELKSRIRAALEGELAKNPDNRRLHTQLLSVGRAKICTIDSFCLDLIRTHFDDLGLSPRISIADEAQAKLTAKTVMNTLIDDYFDGNITDEAKTIDDFGAFTDLFATARASSALADVLLSVRETVNGYEEGVDWLFAQAKALSASAQTPFLQSPPGAGLLCELRAWCAEWLAQYRALCEFLDSDAVYAKNYGDCFLFERDWLYALESLLAQAPDWDAVRAHLLSFSAPALKSGIRGDKKTQDIIRAKNRHDQFGEQRKAYTERYFTVSAAELRTLNLAQAEVIRKLGIFLSVYEERLAQEKRRRNQLDFGDMGRLALRLLWDAQAGTPTAAARAESLKYEEIYIDEYQDVSPVQDLIFRAIARGDNRFMVGDAKQSIYGFRGASPELFLNYRAQFAADPSAGRTIFLSDNFRCDKQIIDFSNLVFSVLFGRGGGILPYTDDDALRYAKRPEGEAQQTAVSLALFASDCDETEGDDDAPETEAAADNEDGPYTENVYIADCVEQLLRCGHKRDGSRIRPRDIAILLRSAKTAAEPIAAA